MRPNETSLRSRTLDLAIQVIAASAPIKSKDVAQRLSAIDARIDRSLVNSVLYHEGAAAVDYDEGTGLYRPKNTR